jgi:DNA-binding NarL/FixJ family response regulator
VLVAAGRGREARALPVTDLVSLAAKLSRDSRLVIDFRSFEQLGQPLVVLSVTSGSLSPRFDALTVREREVAACVASGLPNREIAARLWLTTATVKDHVHRILTKTGLPNRTAIAAAWERE